jgi:hypothetical protein
MVVTWSYSGATNTATASGAGSTNFAALVAADTAGGWGKFTADATGTQIICAGLIIIGDGTNAAVFSDTTKQVLFITGVRTANNAKLITCAVNSTLTLGTEYSSARKIGKNGCAFVDADATYYGYIIAPTSNTGGTINLYGCSFSTTGGKESWWLADKAYTISCYGSAYPMHGAINTSKAGDYAYVLNTGYTGTRRPTSACTFTNFYVDVTDYGVYFQTYAGTVKNSTLRGNQYLAFLDNVPADCTFINVDSPNWTFRWLNAGTYKLIRQYEFDLTTDTSAVVTLKNTDGSTAFSVTSDAVTGAIATQTVSRGYYAQATGNTLQDYGPFTLTITKAGKMPYTQTGIVLSEKTKLLIALRTQLLGTTAVGDVANGETFYSDDADVQLTGTLALTGNADATDVVTGKTFYKDDLYTQLTGTYVTPTTGGRHHLSAQQQKDLDLLEPSLMLNAVLLIKDQKRKRDEK